MSPRWTYPGLHYAEAGTARRVVSKRVVVSLADANGSNPALFRKRLGREQPSTGD